MVVSSFSYAIASFINSDGAFYAISYISRLVQGIADAQICVSIFSMTSIEFTVNTAKYQGAVQGALATGMLLGPVIAGILYPIPGVRYPGTFFFFALPRPLPVFAGEVAPLADFVATGFFSLVALEAFALAGFIVFLLDAAFFFGTGFLRLAAGGRRLFSFTTTVISSKAASSLSSEILSTLCQLKCPMVQNQRQYNKWS